MSKPKLNTIEEVIASMEHRFQPEASKQLKADFQWQISGPTGRDFCLRVNDGAFHVVDGVVPDPSVTFQTDDVTYLRLVNGDLKGMTAILTRKLTMRGSIYLATKMDTIFK
jgi:putative sterol carrier protein